MRDDKTITNDASNIAISVRDAPVSWIHDILSALDKPDMNFIDEEGIGRDHGLAMWRLRCEIELLRRERGWLI